MAHVLGDEELARHLAHRLQDALVGDPATAELALDHLSPLGVEVRSGSQKGNQKM
jgi:hypothetical protein